MPLRGFNFFRLSAEFTDAQRSFEQWGPGTERCPIPYLLWQTLRHQDHQQWGCGWDAQHSEEIPSGECQETTEALWADPDLLESFTPAATSAFFFSPSLLLVYCGVPWQHTAASVLGDVSAHRGWRRDIHDCYTQCVLSPPVCLQKVWSQGRKDKENLDVSRWGFDFKTLRVIKLCPLCVSRVQRWQERPATRKRYHHLPASLFISPTHIHTHHV